MQPGEHIDGRAGKQLAHGAALAERRHEEGLAAFARQRRRGERHAEAIGVGLDHGGAFGAAEA